MSAGRVSIQSYSSGAQTKKKNHRGLLSSMLTEHVKGINGEGEWRAIHESYMNQKEEKIKKEAVSANDGETLCHGPQ